MSSSLYEEFFLHFFVDSQIHKFSYLCEKFKPYQNPTLDRPKKASELGYLKNYKSICSKYLQYVSSDKMEIKFSVTQTLKTIWKVYEEYLIFFEKGGAYRIFYNARLNGEIGKLKSFIQQLTLIKLCQGFSQKRSQFKSLDKYILNFFFTLNYIKTCNIDVRGFCMLLYGQNEDENLNIQNIFGNFLIRKLSVPQQNPNNQTDLQDEQISYQKDLTINIRNFQKLLKILSKDEELTNLSILTHQQSQSSSIHNINQFSTIKSVQLKQQPQIILAQETIRSVVALQILFNFLKNNQIKLTQIKIYKLLKLVGVIKEEKLQKQEEQKNNPFANLKSWEDVLNFCFQKNTLTKCNGDDYLLKSNEISDQFQLLNDRMPYQRILLMEICRKNFNVSQKLFEEQGLSFEALQNYREQSYQFILNYLNELFYQKCNSQGDINYQILKKLKRIYNFGNVVLKPLISRVLKHPQMHKIYLKYFQHSHC